MTKHVSKAIGARSAFVLLIPIALVVFGLDQLSKYWAERDLVVGDAPINFIGELIQFRLIYNPGAALSLGTSATALLTFVSVVVVFFALWIAPRLTSKVWVITAALLLGGTLGNLTDRLFRAPGFPKGHVVDFIDYGPFVGNVADIAIVAAACLLALLSLLGRSPLVEKEDTPSPDESSAVAGDVLVDDFVMQSGSDGVSKEGQEN